ncbi:MAG: hypothetical protein ACT4TC_26235 [Myxococcaceae bacterium]
MAEQKGLGSKILGMFVESEDGSERPEGDEKEKSPAEIVAELAGQSDAAAKGPALKLDKLTSPGGAPGAPLDFDAIFRDAGMDAAELDRVKKAEDLLRSLPESTPLPVKKQIVEASLKAFGFEVEKIVAAAQNQKRALDTYVRVNETTTAKAIQDANAQIQSLNEKIAALRGEIDKRTSGLSSLGTAAQTRKMDVQKVLDFFQTQAPATP